MLIFIKAQKFKVFRFNQTETKIILRDKYLHNDLDVFNIILLTVLIFATENML